MATKARGKFKPLVFWGRPFTFEGTAPAALTEGVPSRERDRFIERVEHAVGDYLTDCEIMEEMPRAKDVRAACDELADHALWLTQRVRWADAATRAGITTALLYHVRTPVSDPGAFLDRLRYDLALLHEAAIRAKMRSPKGRSGRRPDEARRRLARRFGAAFRDTGGRPTTTENGAFAAGLRVTFEAAEIHVADIRPWVRYAVRSSRPAPSPSALV